MVLSLEFYQHLAAARKEFTVVVKDKANSHFKNRYATVDSILEAITPVLEKHNFLLLCPVTVAGLNVTLVDLTNGELYIASYPLDHDLAPQGRGAAETYALRYALRSLFLLEFNDDDDGNTAQQAHESKAMHQATKSRPPGRPNKGEF